MSDSTTPSRDRRSYPRLLLQWLLRFLGWSALVVLAGVLLTVAVGLLAYFNRVSLINDALANYVEPFEVKVGKIDFLPLGTVSISDLQLHPKKAKVEEPLLAVPKVTLTYRFQELRKDRKFETVVFEKPSIQLSEETLITLRKARESTTTPTTPLDLETFSFFSKNLEVREGQLSLDLLNAPPVFAHWDLTVNSPAFDDENWLVSPIQWNLRSVAIGPDGDWGKFEQIDGDLAFRKDLTAARVTALRIPESDLTITPEWLAQSAELTDSIKEADSTSAPSFDLVIGQLEIGNTHIELRGFDGESGTPKIPDTRLDTKLSLAGITSTGGRWDSESPLAIELSNVEVGARDEPISFVEILSLRADSLGAAVHDQRIDRLEFIGWDLVLTESSTENLSLFDQADPAQKKPDSSHPVWEIGEVEIVGGHLLTDDIEFSGTPVPRIETQFGASLKALRVGGRIGLESESVQRILFEQSRLWAPQVGLSDDLPLLSWQRAEVTGRWDEFTASNQVESLTLRGPEINFTDESLGAWIEPPQPSPERPGPINRPVYKITNLLVTGGRLVADSSFADQIVPKVLSDFRIETIREPGTAPFTYDVILNDLELKNHAVFLDQLAEVAPDTSAKSLRPVNAEDVLRMDQLKLRATASGLQRKREIESLKISGALLKVGEGLNAIVNRTSPKTAEPNDVENATPGETSPQPAPLPSDTTDDEPTPPATPDQAATAEAPKDEDKAPKLPSWTVKKLEVVGSTVQFEALIPQIEGLKFDVNTILNDVPLSPDGLLAQEEIQQVELSNIEIKDPYDSFITVAELPTIFVKFSLAGLVNQEIDQIDLINPSLYVGQGLFWWIDYQRNFRAQNEGASVGLAQGGPVVQKPDWSIRELNATAGKIVVAPTGIPIGIVPFPFNATTKLENGEIELTLKIPDEEHVYSFPDYKVELSGLTGDVLFNVPVKNESNNLVQKFFLDQINWKKYEAKDLYLVVTFDENGIYGDLGGYAYSGYVKAGFNFYLDNPGKWDAWISGTDLSTSPITQILAPDNFIMEGPISIDLVSEGFRKKLGETTAEIQTTGPGWFDVTKLDAILENFPEDWTGWQESLAELSLIALKRFDYDKGSGSLYLLGRDGLFSLRFAGPYGLRELNLHLHDNRNKTAGVDSGTPSDSIENPAAEIAE